MISRCLASRHERFDRLSANGAWHIVLSPGRALVNPCDTQLSLTLFRIIMNLRLIKTSAPALGGLIAALIATLGFASGVHAQQSFSAIVDGTPWESDNAGINVIPVPMRGTVTIIATSKAFSAYPPPKGFPDSFSIVCPMPKKPERMTTARGSSEVCRVSFTKSARNIMSPDWAKTKNEGEFVTLGRAGDKGYVNFTKVSGKTIEGEFSVELTEETTKKKIAVNGKFVGIDRQVGSNGFN